ncbi:BMC domain-containing protein [Romboutsia weinsteinii]|uniref:BMC domain-containing protein n=1 Tax=Romboutsia weinsteinii TaxID=2020949 RepID=A0A371J275_9FIRM|nr:BMC domain-containing protein [Romboutsia weinsteinii]RDY26783.1 BMC domain-containing protein [Romboutsia weinsteinii]
MNHALGMIETKGLIGAIEAANSMLKSANITLIGYEKIGFGLVTVMVSGDIDEINIAVEAGVEAARCIGEVYSVLIIQDPHEEIEKMIKNSNKN